jgi:hypothetical protein
MVSRAKARAFLGSNAGSNAACPGRSASVSVVYVCF